MATAGFGLRLGSELCAGWVRLSAGFVSFVFFVCFLITGGVDFYCDIFILINYWGLFRVLSF